MSKDNYNISMYEPYCILIPYNENIGGGYCRYLEKYIFRSNDVAEQIIENTENLDDISQKYILVYDKDNETINSWIKANYPDQLGNDVIIR